MKPRQIKKNSKSFMTIAVKLKLEKSFNCFEFEPTDNSTKYTFKNVWCCKDWVDGSYTNCHEIVKMHLVATGILLSLFAKNKDGKTMRFTSTDANLIKECRKLIKLGVIPYETKTN